MKRLMNKDENLELKEGHGEEDSKRGPSAELYEKKTKETSQEKVVSRVM